MRTQDLGLEIRKARQSKNLTQAELARAVSLSRETINLLESGLVRDLGIRKVLAVLDHLGLEIHVAPKVRARGPDYIAMACTTASVSYRKLLSEYELVRALITGKVPPLRSAHMRTLFEEAPGTLLRGVVREAAKWVKPGKLEKNIRKLADALGVSKDADRWLNAK